MSLRVQIKPGESLMVRTLDGKSTNDQWNYTTEGEPVTIEGNWEVSAPDRRTWNYRQLSIQAIWFPGQKIPEDGSTFREQPGILLRWNYLIQKRAITY